MGAVRMRVQTADKNLTIIHTTIFVFWPEAMVSNSALMMDLYHVNTSSQDVNWWTGAVWIIVMFLSAVWTLILTAPIHCRASIAEQVIECYISPNMLWGRSKLIYILEVPRVNIFSEKFDFGANYFYSLVIKIDMRYLFFVNLPLSVSTRLFCQVIKKQLIFILIRFAMWLMG